MQGTSCLVRFARGAGCLWSLSEEARVSLLRSPPKITLPRSVRWSLICFFVIIDSAIQPAVSAMIDAGSGYDHGVHDLPGHPQ